MSGADGRQTSILLLLHEVVQQIFLKTLIAIEIIGTQNKNNRKRKCRGALLQYSLIERIPTQVQHMNRLIGVTDISCIVNLRMDRSTFGRLCRLLREIGGLKDGKNLIIEEQVAMYLVILAHHKKNRVVSFDFWRSGCTVSRYVHRVLNSIIKLHSILLVKPEPVKEDCTDRRWKSFQGCLGALDGTYINVTVSSEDKPRYRTRKGQISTNTLAVCDRLLRFVYVLPGWEGSAGDSRVLRDAVNRVHGLKVPKGNYYLCDNGYANSDGFLTPYKGVRYHLKEWGPHTERPQNAHEIFNMRHTRARNVIERAFGVMKARWGILRSPSFYPIKTQTRMIMTCFLLHNFIRSSMEVDPFEHEAGIDGRSLDNDDEHDNAEYVDGVESSPEWTRFRDELAHSMWQEVCVF